MVMFPFHFPNLNKIRISNFKSSSLSFISNKEEMGTLAWPVLHCSLFYTNASLGFSSSQSLYRQAFKLYFLC